MIAAAIALALIYGKPEPPAPPPPPAAPLAPATPMKQVAPSPADPGLSFVIAFEDAHQFAEAQRLAGQGRLPDAEAAAAEALRAAPELRGLCLDRFTLGGAEVVLRLCPDAPPDLASRSAAEWSMRFAAMRAVAYADVNTVAEIDQNKAP